MHGRANMQALYGWFLLPLSTMNHSNDVTPRPVSFFVPVVLVALIVVATESSSASPNRCCQKPVL